MSDKYKNMNNKDFKQYCIDEGIDVDSKNVSKPTRAEYIAAIEKFESKFAIKVVDSEETQEDDDFAKEVELIKESVKVNNAEEEVQQGQKAQEVGGETRSQKRRRMYNQLHALKRVIITNNSTNQTKTDGIERISWGNRMLGHQTDNVVIGKPWHVREGALRNLRAATITEPIQDEDGNQVKFETKPAWIVQELDPLTKEQIEAIAKKQTIRDASIDSLI